jgi:hypothetical protein
MLVPYDVKAGSAKKDSSGRDMAAPILSRMYSKDNDDPLICISIGLRRDREVWRSGVYLPENCRMTHLDLQGRVAFLRQARVHALESQSRSCAKLLREKRCVLTCGLVWHCLFSFKHFKFP